MARCGSEIGTRLADMAMRDVVTSVVVPDPAGDGDPENDELRCELCGLDLMIPNMYVPLVLLFDGAALAPRYNSSWSELVEELKQSLAKVLVPFYPLAGRVVQRPGQPPHLLCNNAGAVFTSAQVDAPMTQVYSPSPSAGAHADFQPVPQISDLAVEMEAVEKPALVVQVTGFQCGGVALAVNWLHQVADGFSASKFLKAWSDACAGGSGLGLLQPEHGRAQALKEAHFLDGALEFSDQDLAADYTPPGLEGVLWTRDMAATLQTLAANAPAHQTSVARLIHYTEAGIRKLKADAAAGAGLGEHFSTVTCVSAHLWQCLTRARLQLIREAQAQGVENAYGPSTCVATTSVDAKVRRTTTTTTTGSCAGDPATLLPQSYFGNSILTAQTREVEAEEVARQPLGFAASLIKDSVAGIHLRAFQYVLGLAHKHGAPNITMMPRGAAHDFVTSSWYRFPFYDLRFCFAAKPVLAVCNFPPIPLPGGFAFFLPSPLGPNNLTAMLYANASVIDNLCLDPHFLNYAY